MKRIFSLIIVLIFSGINAWSQEVVTEEVQEMQKSQNLATQFKTLKETAETYGEFKVFRESRLNDFWFVVNDSLNTLKEDLDVKQAAIDTQLNEITELNALAKENEDRFQQNEFAGTHISFLGIDFSKSSFIVITTVLIGGLALVLFMGFMQYSKNRQIALKSVSECAKLEHEFEDFRKKSLEKQIKLNRDLQTERNKIEELRNKSTISKRISA